MIDKKQALKEGIKIIDSKESCNALFDNLKANFPQTIKDNAPDLKAIATLLGLNDKANMQGYELTFTGKVLANELYSTPTQKMLTFKTSFFTHTQNNEQNTNQAMRQDFGDKNGALQEKARELPKVVMTKAEAKPLFLAQKPTHTSVEAQNFIIKGDNLDVLKILKSAYSEKIKMIYIDPPYNTKNDNFIYPDNFRKDYKEILQAVGLLEIDDEGNEIESETLQFFKNIQSTRTHSGWLSFMLPRLKLARDLLREDGVIFISIDDNEQANLKILCDEIFGEDNFVEVLHWKRKKQPSFLSKHVAGVMEYILVYAKQADILEKLSLETLSDATKKVTNITNTISVRNFKRGMRVKLQGSGTIQKGVYQIRTMSIEYLNDVVYENGKTKNDIKIKAKFSVSQDKINKYIDEDLIFITTNYSLRRNVSEEERQKDKSITNLLMDWGDNQDSDKEIIEIFNDKIFDTPKPIKLIKNLLKTSTNTNDSDYILDFFAGSGTTAHAVMELNAEDKGNRKFILVQLDEPINEDKSKTAYDFCKNELKSENPVISDITIERVKRANIKIAKENPGFNIGFSVLSLIDKRELITDKEGTLKLLNHKIEPKDIALNLALQSGKTLDKEIKTIFENKLYACEDCLYLIACDKEVLEYLNNTHNEYIFIDAFSDIGLENFLNLSVSINDRLRIVY